MSDYVESLQLGNGEIYDYRDKGALRSTGLLDLVYPVGSLYFSTVATNPGTLFGGSWTRYGKGQVLVGVDENDAAFSSVGKTGGSKDAVIPRHDHSATFSGRTIPAHQHGVAGISVKTPKLTSHYGDFVHTPIGASALRGTINGSSSANYFYLRRPAAGGSSGGGGPNYTETVMRETTGTSSVVIDAGETCAVSGNTASAGQHVPEGSVSVSPTGVVASGTNLQPYITCYIWRRTA